jgi:hypothetical protein
MKLIKDLPFDDYLAKKEYLSNHQLGHLEDCPAAFQYYLVQPPEPPSADMIEGSCFDLAMKSADLFHEKVTRDDKRKTIAEQDNGNYLLGWERYDRLLIMAENVKSHPVIARILSKGTYQASVFTELHGVQVKSRPDFLPDHLPVIVDFKTTRENPTSRNLAYASAKYKYYRQGAFYLDQQPDRKAFLLVWAPKVKPYLPVVEELTEETLAFGRQKYQELLEVYLRCTETGIWPGHWQIRKHELPQCILREGE